MSKAECRQRTQKSEEDIKLAAFLVLDLSCFLSLFLWISVYKYILDHENMKSW